MFSSKGSWDLTVHNNMSTTVTTNNQILQADLMAFATYVVYEIPPEVAEADDYQLPERDVRAKTTLQVQIKT